MTENLQRRIEELELALRRERHLVASERQRHEQELAAIRRRLASQNAGTGDKQIARLERALADVYSSRTWRVGRAIWTVFHLPGALVRRIRRSGSSASETPQSHQALTPAPQVPEPVPSIDYSLLENTVVRQKYEAALSRQFFSGHGNGRNLAVAVSTTDLDEGRGDLYTAVGLGRHLGMLGYDVVYLPQKRWYEPPRHTDIYLALLETVDVTQLPVEITTVAWVRNQTEGWVTQPSLPMYDLILSSSQRSLETLHTVYAGPTGLLAVGVDTELFNVSGRLEDRRGVVSTVNQWGRERELHTYLQTEHPSFPLALFGEQRGVAPVLAPYCRGPISFFALSALYNEATVVLDDFNHTTAAYGNVNSRVFEAAACGAIVMTNRAIMADNVDVGQVPAFTSAIELHRLIERDLNSDDAIKAAEERAQFVTEKHSYECRAATFDGHLQRLANDPAPRSDRLVIGHFPDYHDNPYLDMMWSAMRADGAVPVAVGNTLDFSGLFRAAASRPAVFHLNWTAPILGGSGNPDRRSTRYRLFLDALDQLQDRGVSTIWTVHNVLPHECADPVLEAQLRQEIADRVDLIHVMCEETAQLCSGYFELPQSKIRVLPHPSYIDVYPNLVDKETARYELRLGHGDFVYLHLGKIRPYKGVDRLLDAFDRLARQDPKAKLMLVGESGRFEQLDEIKQRARANPSVISNFNAIPDEDLQLYLNAADVVVLPYRDVLNSGALQLAYSFAKPVVASTTGCIPSQVDATTGLTFSWEDGEQALLNAMLSARELRAEHGQAAYERATHNHYLGISGRFNLLVDEALALYR